MFLDINNEYIWIVFKFVKDCILVYGLYWIVINKKMFNICNYKILYKY